MRFLQSKLISLKQDTCALQCPADLNYQPGQYFLATGADQLEPLPVVLFPVAKEKSVLIIERPASDAWRVGTALNLRGPLGRGFQVPPGVRRIALVDCRSENRPAALFEHWAPAFLERGGELAYYSDFPPSGLPTDVEGLPLEQAGEAWKWAEYLAADVDFGSLGRLLKILRPGHDTRLPDKAEVLIRTSMVCGGLAECGLCVVKTVKGFRLACKDGPVFQMNDLTPYAAALLAGDR